MIVARWTRCWSARPGLFRSRRLLEECRTFVTFPTAAPARPTARTTTWLWPWPSPRPSAANSSSAPPDQPEACQTSRLHTAATSWRVTASRGARDARHAIMCRPTVRTTRPARHKSRSDRPARRRLVRQDTAVTSYSSHGASYGHPGSAGNPADARRRAEPADARRRRQALGSQVPEQSAAPARAGQRAARHPPGRGRRT